MSSRPPVLAALCAALLLGGCIGGLFGTGDENAADGGISGTGGDLGNASSPTGTAGTTDATDAEGTRPEDGDDDAAPPASAPDAGADGESDADAGPGDGRGDDDSFVNDALAHDGPDALLRIVNLTARATRVEARGVDAGPFALDPASVGPAVGLDVAVDSLVVASTGGGDGPPDVIDRIEVRLGAGTLTTLLVFPDADGAPAASLVVTDATGPEGGVAAVRVIRAVETGRAGDSLDALELRPAGDDPGGSATGFEPVAPGAAVSAYVLVTPGDYLPIDGDAAIGDTLSLDAGDRHSLVLGDPGDGGAPVIIIDSDLGPETR